MKTSIERPFKPVALIGTTAEAFALRTLAQELRTDKAYTDHGRSALTLVRGEGLTLVLTAVRAGKVCEQHTSEGPTVILTLLGSIAVVLEETADRILLESGTAVALAPQIFHRVRAHTDSAFLTVIGEQADLRTLASDAA